MKKLFALMLALAMMLSLVACSGGGDTSGDTGGAGDGNTAGDAAEGDAAGGETGDDGKAMAVPGVVHEPDSGAGRGAGMTGKDGRSGMTGRLFMFYKEDYIYGI